MGLGTPLTRGTSVENMLTDAFTPEVESDSLILQGQFLTLADLGTAVRRQRPVKISADPKLAEQLKKSVELVAKAVEEGQPVYGVTTGFGGMADNAVPAKLAGELQNNLLSFLAAGAGDPVDERHVRGAMLLRANVLLKGCSGVRLEMIQRLIRFLDADAIPVVRDLGSIGASGDLIPLATIARAICGQSACVKVQHGDRLRSGPQVLADLNLAPLQLLPKEGLALVNGTSFSAAIAANATNEARQLMALATATQAMLMRSLLVNEQPFGAFVQECKPHPGQVWSAKVMRDLLAGFTNTLRAPDAQVQDRYSLRCFPQYMGPIAEGIAQVQKVVETEMNAVSDNPLIDCEDGTFHQSGNFLGQYVALAMDDLRRHIGLLAKHLDVQIASLVAPPFNGGLSASLRGNDEKSSNMGLKGLQICGNSIMPLLTWYANPIVQHFPTHAEQYNQNINGLSWGAANLAWKSVQLFQQYTAVSLIFAVQSLDLRSHALHGHYDGSSLLGDLACPLYEAVCHTLKCEPNRQQPLLFDDADRWIEQDIESLANDIKKHGAVWQAVRPILNSFDDSFGTA